MLLDKAFELLNTHRIAGDTLLMMTATHEVVAEPVAARLGFEHWLGSAVGITDNAIRENPRACRAFKKARSPTSPVGASATWGYQTPLIRGSTLTPTTTCRC